MNSAKRPCLPLFKSMAEAVALSQNERDTFPNLRSATINPPNGSPSAKPWPRKKSASGPTTKWTPASFTSGLLKLHNWTYRDLMNVVGAILTPPAVSPCEREQVFASRCDTRLGLRKTGHGKTAENGRPAGYKKGQGKFVRFRPSGPLRLEQPRSVLERGIQAAPLGRTAAVSAAAR